MAQSIATYNDAFISYSRKDIEFAKRLVQALKQEGHGNIWVDWENIEYSEDWWESIKAGIESANHFLFIISPESASSPVCHDEVEHALQLGKRLIPILHRPISHDLLEHGLHPAIARHHWLPFKVGDDFEQGVRDLLQTFRLDIYHTREHTRLLMRAIEWREHGRERARLLTGSEIDSAEAWLAQAATKSPSPTQLHSEYIYTSRQNQRRTARRLLYGALAAFAISLFLALVAFIQAGIARSAQEIASAAQRLAEQRAEQAQSLAWAAQAANLSNQDPQLALLLALEANRNANIAPQAELVLNDLAYGVGIRRLFEHHPSGISPSAISGLSFWWDVTQRFMLTASNQRMVLWDEAGAPLKAYAPPSTGAFQALDFMSNVVFATLNTAVSPHPQNPSLNCSVGEILTGRTNADDLSLTPLFTAPLIGTLNANTCQSDKDSRFSSLVAFPRRNPNQNTVVVAQAPDYIVHVDERRNVLASIVSTAGIKFMGKVVASPDGVGYLSVSAQGEGDYRLLYRSVRTGEAIRIVATLTSQADGIYGLGYDMAFTPDSQRALIIVATQPQLDQSQARAIDVYDIVNRSRLARLDEHRGAVRVVSISPDGKRALSGDSSGEIIEWDLESYRLVRRLIGHTSAISAISYVPLRLGEAPSFVSADEAGNILQWEIESPNAYSLLELTPELTPSVPSLDTWTLQNDAGNVQLNNLSQTYSIALPVPPFAAWRIMQGIAMSPDETRYLARVEDGTGQSGIALYDIATDTRTASLRYVQLQADGVAQPDERSAAFWARFSSDGRLWISYNAQRQPIIWDVQDGQRRLTLEHPAPVVDAVFSTDGTQIASVMNDGTVTLWDVNTGLARRNLGRVREFIPRQIAYANDGNSLQVFADRNYPPSTGRMAEWRFVGNSQALIQWVCGNRAVRQFSAPERERYGIPERDPICPDLSNPSTPPTPPSNN